MPHFLLTTHLTIANRISYQKMLFVELQDGRSFAVRPSGTEPNIKYYLFGKAAPGGDLPASKERVHHSLDRLWCWIQDDAKAR